MAIVTGAARGIGAAIALRLASDGFSIAAVDVRACDETVGAVTARGGLATAFSCDVREWDDVQLTVSEIEQRMGALTAVVSVAGVWQHVPFLELDPQRWHAVLDVNLEGTFNVCRNTAVAMADRRHGSIVCIASNAADLAWDGGAHYSASKAAIVGLVKGMALELGPHQIRVNAVCPGTIRTPSTTRELDDPAMAKVQAQACPLGRVGEPADVAEAVSFLVDETRAGWITGSSLLVDGGYGTHGEGAFGFSLTNTTLARRSAGRTA